MSFGTFRINDPNCSHAASKASRFQEYRRYRHFCHNRGQSPIICGEALPTISANLLPSPILKYRMSPSSKCHHVLKNLYSVKIPHLLWFTLAEAARVQAQVLAVLVPGRVGEEAVGGNYGNYLFKMRIDIYKKRT